MSKCISFKIRTKTKNKQRTIYYYCTKLRKEINYDICRNCDLKEYKQSNFIKKRTNKLARSEKNRFSIICSCLDKCCICGAKNGINKHEIFYGKNRQNSIKYGLVIPLCDKHHTGQNGIHFNKELCEFYHKKGQTIFNEVYPDLDFLEIFKRNYL